MNDDELRAFLESASSSEPDEKQPADALADQGEGDEPQRSGADIADHEPEPERSSVPSFDELMGFPPPAAHSGDEQTGVDAASASQGEGEEHLVPLILPGFSSDSRPKRPLPPVFQADAAEPAGAEPFADPAPTQPFDVLPEPATPASATRAEATRDTEPPAVDAQAPDTPHTPDIFAPIAAAAGAAPVAASRTPDTSPLPAVPDQEDPFAALSLRADASAEHDSATQSGDSGDDDGYEKISVTGSAPRGRRALPWIIVGGGAVIAIIASILVINGVRGSSEPEPSPSPPVTTEPTTPSPEPEPEPTTPEPEPEPEGPPEVDPGDTYSLEISQWGITVERSNAFGGSTPYELQDGNTRAMFELPLAQSLPESCAAARTGWGLLRSDDGKLEVIRPEPRCADADAAAVYDKIWGLMYHMAKTARAS